MAWTVRIVCYTIMGIRTLLTSKKFPVHGKDKNWFLAGLRFRWWIRTLCVVPATCKYNADTQPMGQIRLYVIQSLNVCHITCTANVMDSTEILLILPLMGESGDTCIVLQVRCSSTCRLHTLYTRWFWVDAVLSLPWQLLLAHNGTLSTTWFSFLEYEESVASLLSDSVASGISERMSQNNQRCLAHAHQAFPHSVRRWHIHAWKLLVSSEDNMRMHLTWDEISSFSVN